MTICHDISKRYKYLSKSNSKNSSINDFYFKIYPLGNFQISKTVTNSHFFFLNKSSRYFNIWWNYLLLWIVYFCHETGLNHLNCQYRMFKEKISMQITNFLNYQNMVLKIWHFYVVCDMKCNKMLKKDTNRVNTQLQLPIKYK